MPCTRTGPKAPRVRAANPRHDRHTWQDARTEVRNDVEQQAEDGPVAVTSDPIVDGDGATAETGSAGRVRYEIVFECRDRMVGGRLAARIEEVIGPTFPVAKGEEGPTWSVTIEFPSPAAGDRFFASDFYRQFCIEVRRSAHSSVLVVPMGPLE